MVIISPDSSETKNKLNLIDQYIAPPINIRFIFIFLSGMSFYIVSYLMNNIFFALNHLFYV